MQTVWSLVLWLACSTAPAPVDVHPEGVAEGASAVRAGLTHATELLGGGDRVAAAAAVRDTYRSHFEPLEDVLRATDPQTTFELEYAFGAIAHELDGEGDAAAVRVELVDLSRRVDSLAAQARAAAAAAAGADATGPGSETKRTGW